MITREFVDSLTRDECERLLKKLHKSYDFTTPITQLTYSTQLIEQITTELLYLEDRIARIDNEEAVHGGLVSALNKRGIEYKPHIMTPRGSCLNVQAASALMGLSEKTILSYLSVKPEQYYRCD
jgi:hypothetical protein